MKILTLNTHSYLENDFQKKLGSIILAILREKFDIIAFQEVNQRCDSKPARKELLEYTGFVPADESVIKRNNFALHVARKLRKLGLNYNWSWVNNHIGYDIYDEGVALLSLNDIIGSDSFFISQSHDPKNYKTRKVLGLKVLDHTTNNPTWFYSSHMGWWNDIDDPFKNQWQEYQKSLSCNVNENVYIMGDFNSPANVKFEGYDLITKDGNWFDTYTLALDKDLGDTVLSSIDGWNQDDIKSMRIDYIFKNNNKPIYQSKTIFNGTNYPIVSDHFGLYINENKSLGGQNES